MNRSRSFRRSWKYSKRQVSPFDLPKLTAELKELHAQMNEPDFWNDVDNANKVSQKTKQIENKIARYESLVSRADDTMTLIEMAVEEEDLSLLEEVESEVRALDKAAENTTLDHTIEAEWADFRGTSYTYDEASGELVAGGTKYSNNGVVSSPMPISTAESMLYWSNQLGEGFDKNAVGCPILVDGDLITYSNNQLFRVDAVSGEVLATGTMIDGSSFAINPPTYYDGMLFVGLSRGRIQAFDAKTLKPLWL